MFKPHEHDHGPIDSPLDSALTSVSAVTVKKSLAKTDEDRPPVKKQKPEPSMESVLMEEEEKVETNETTLQIETSLEEEVSKEEQ